MSSQYFQSWAHRREFVLGQFVVNFELQKYCLFFHLLSTKRSKVLLAINAGVRHGRLVSELAYGTDLFFGLGWNLREAQQFQVHLRKVLNRKSVLGGNSISA